MNFYSLFNLILGAIQLIGFAYLAFLQFKEVRRPRSSITQVRWLLFFVLISSVVTLAPSLAYQGIRFFGYENEIIRNFVTVVSRMNGLLQLVLIFGIFKMQIREDNLPK